MILLLALLLLLPRLRPLPPPPRAIVVHIADEGSVLNSPANEDAISFTTQLVLPSVLNSSLQALVKM